MGISDLKSKNRGYKMTKIVSKCLWCGSSKLETFTHRKDGVGILECKKCGLFMLDSIPDNLEDEYYNEAYYNSNNNIDTGYSEVYDLMPPAFLLWQNSLIEEIFETKDKKYFLEIGCATGNLLEIIRDNQNNLDIEGIDVANYAIDTARKKNLDAKVAYIDNYIADDKKDIIFSSETLEHIENPMAFMKGVINNLKPDGVFIFYVPSISVNDAKKYKNNYLRFNTNLEHLLHFTPDFIKREFGNLFDNKIVVKEFITGYGPCIIGAASRNRKSLINLKLLFKALDDNEIPLRSSDVFLNNLAIISLKFGKFRLAEKAIGLLDKKRNVDESKIFLLKGLSGFHNGNLLESISSFESYLRLNPGNQLAIKSILSNERELNKVLKIKIDKLNNDYKSLELSLSSIEKELNLKHSKIINKVVKFRKVLHEVLGSLKNIKNKIKNRVSTDDVLKPKPAEEKKND